MLCTIPERKRENFNTLYRILWYGESFWGVQFSWTGNLYCWYLFSLIRIIMPTMHCNRIIYYSWRFPSARADPFLVKNTMSRPFWKTILNVYLSAFIRLSETVGKSLMTRIDDFICTQRKEKFNTRLTLNPGSLSCMELMEYNIGLPSTRKAALWF